MQISYHKDQDIHVFRLDGTLAQAYTKIAKEAITPYIENPEVFKVMVNLEKVPFMDSSGIGLIVSFFNTMQERNGSFILCELGDHLQEIMKTTRLDAVLTICATEEEALSSSHSE
jgi:anti-sigma B factor antagonist